MKLRTIIADDELQARKRLARLCDEAGDVEVIASCANAEEVLAKLSLDPDLLLLDISMPGLTGIELRRRIPGSRPAVIFVTAHTSHAVDAFDVGAVDYVVKPVTGARLEQALARVRQRPAIDAAAPRISITTRTGVVLVDPLTITHAELDNELVTIHSATTSWISEMTLKDLEALLPSKFIRADRRHLLNLDEVVRLEDEPDGGYLAVTRGGAKVPVSRQASRDLRKRLGL